MSKRQILCALGVLIIIFLFLGLPSFWDKIIAVLSGLLIIFISYNLPVDTTADKKESETFVENRQ